MKVLRASRGRVCRVVHTPPPAATCSRTCTVAGVSCSDARRASRWRVCASFARPVSFRSIERFSSSHFGSFDLTGSNGRTVGRSSSLPSP
eukprot:2410404-Prymnesium_polylepis.4